jgi:hypothetical protein
MLVGLERFDKEVMAAWYEARVELLPRLTELWAACTSDSIARCALRFMHEGLSSLQMISPVHYWGQPPAMPRNLGHLQCLELNNSIPTPLMSQIIRAAPRLQTISTRGALDWATFEQISRVADLRELRVYRIEDDGMDAAERALSGGAFARLEVFVVGNLTEDAAVLRTLVCSAELASLRKLVGTVASGDLSPTACASILAGLARFRALVALELWARVADVPDEEPFVDRAMRTARVLGPLRSLAALERLSLTLGVPFAFERAALLRTAASWPCLHHLELGKFERGTPDVRAPRPRQCPRAVPAADEVPRSDRLQCAADAGRHR